MPEITLEAIEAKHAETAELIAKFKAQASIVRIAVAAFAVQLQPGERYAGAVLDEKGRVKHHLVLMAPRPDVDLDWDAANAWATEAGGVLPVRQEQALLFANCKDALPQRWCWSSEPNGSSYAWGCVFDDGTQSYGDRSAEGAAVAVRRLNP